MTLLSIANRAQAVLNLAQTSTFFSHTAESSRQLLQLAQLGGTDIADEYSWQVLRTESSFVTTATETQTNFTMPSDFGWIVDETLYNRTAVRKIVGPIGEREWQEQKAFGNAGADSQFMFRGNSLLMAPTPTAGHSVYFVYVSTKWCQSSLSVAQTAWLADTDTARIKEHVLTLDLIWRWKAAKGLDYQEDWNVCEVAKQRAAGRDGAKRKLSAAGPSSPRVWNGRTPEGSWT